MRQVIDMGKLATLFGILAIICFTPSVFADNFLHEGDYNYSVSDINMTTQPRLNDYLALNFKLQNSANSTAIANKHVHISILDSRGRIVNDYTVKLVPAAKTPLEKALNHVSVEKSTGYEFFRTLEENTLEYRLVSNDSGVIKTQIYLNACGINETQNCYFQTAIYTVNVTQSGLNHKENFTVQGERIQGFSLNQLISVVANNPETIILLVIFTIIGLAIAATIIYFVIKIIWK